jgi:hypothetical protein
MLLPIGVATGGFDRAQHALRGHQKVDVIVVGWVRSCLKFSPFSQLRNV